MNHGEIHGGRIQLENIRDAIIRLDALVTRANPASIYIIANNNEANIAELLRAIEIDRENDYICQFNRCIFANDLRELAHNFIFFFSTNETKNPRGFTDQGDPPPVLADFPGHAIGFLLRYGAASEISLIPSSGVHTVKKLDLSVLDVGLVTRSVLTFPGQHLPSAGFTAVALFSIVNCLRIANGIPPHKLVPVGFTGHYATGNPFVHNFDYEQAYYSHNPFIPAQYRGERAAYSPENTLENRDVLDTLRRRFNDGYDFAGVTKAQIITDISEVFYKTGDTESFQRFIHGAMSTNPSAAYRQLSLLVRSLVAEEPDELGHPFLNSVLSKTEKRSAEVDRRWRAGKIHWSPIEVPDIHSANCEYLFKSDGSARRVLILNETFKIGYNSKHLGCYNISKSLNSMLSKNGMVYAGWANNIAGLNEILEADPDRHFDAVVINGEGAFIQNAPRAIELAMMGQYLRSIGKRVFLINTVWRDNGRQMEELCGGFDLIAARDSRSCEAIGKFATNGIFVPDLTWTSPAATYPEKERRGYAVTDSLIPETSLALEEFARQRSLEFRVMSGLFRSFARAVQLNYPTNSVPSPLSEADLGRFGAWISGRLHGVILALRNRSPTVAIAANSSTIQAVLNDIGISNKLFDANSLHQSNSSKRFSEEITQGLEYSETDWLKVGQYQRCAEIETQKLFSRIAAAV